MSRGPPDLGGSPALAQPFPEFPPCSPETTTSTTSSLAPPPTTKICDPGELGSGGAASAPSFVRLAGQLLPLEHALFKVTDCVCLSPCLQDRNC